MKDVEEVEYMHLLDNFNKNLQGICEIQKRKRRNGL